MTGARTLAILVATAVAACQGGGADRPATGSGTGSGAGPGTGDSADEPGPSIPPPPDASTKPEEPDVPDPGKQLAELGAIPAWQAVIDRAQLLARRGQRGVVYGRLGPAILVADPAPPAALDGGVPPDAGLVPSPYAWLVDDTEGNGALGIRVRVPSRLAAKLTPGDRVALGGAWKLDDDRRWYWDVEAADPLPAAPPSDIKDPPAAVPSHAIAIGEQPPGARTITVARDHDAVFFQIVGPPPVNDGDGWAIADELGDPVFALLTLPGERATYGGQDMRSADERWQLKRGQTYWVRIGRIRKRGADKPVAITARTAPVRVL